MGARQNIVGRHDTRLNAPAGGTRPTVPSPSASSNEQRITANSLFNHMHLGVSTFGIMATIPAIELELRDTTHMGLD